MGVLESFEAVLSAPAFRDRISHVFHLPAREAEFGDMNVKLHPLLESTIQSVGSGRLYSHQSRAIKAALTGADVMIVTGTGSGKSLCYNVPVVNQCLTEPVATALYLFPTKALAQDQATNLSKILSPTNIRVGVYDGDTPKSQRVPIRKSASIVVTNPDMLHLGILPQHETWGRFLRSLRTIVIDEAHAYSGVFGSHVAHVVRRLLRVCAWYGSRPNVIACSATISDPEVFYRTLVGRTAEIVDKDGSPRSDRYLAFLTAPSLECERDHSPNWDSASVLASMCASGERTMVFCRSRAATELVVRYARKQSDITTAPLIESYRGGYAPKERRQIEKALYSGKTLGLATTSAMELGVDIGGLDAVVLNGYPGRPTSFWQQSGRAGRGEIPGFTLMVAHDDPLDQFLAREPARLVYGPGEKTHLAPDNKHVLAAQLACAAYERPLSFDDLAHFGDAAASVATEMVDAGHLVEGAGRLFVPKHTSPAGSVNIRGAGGDAVTLVCDGEEVGAMEHWRAMQYAHEGAVYMHRSNTFVVRKLDVEARVALMEKCEPDYYTQSVVQSVVQPTVVLGSRTVGSGRIDLCGVTVTTSVKSYRRLSLEGGSMLGEHPLDLVPQRYSTVGLRVKFDSSFLEDPDLQLAAATHGLEHALLAIAPFMASCDRRDLGSAWYQADPDGFEPSVYVFDVVPGGIGLCEALLERGPEWIESASRLVVDCPCMCGCPACLLSSVCESANEMLDKVATARILHGLSGGSIPR